MKTFHPIKKDSRWTVTHEGPNRFAVRFGEELIDTRTNYQSAVLRAACERAARNGAEVIEEVRALPKGWRKVGDFFEYSTTTGNPNGEKPSAVAKRLGRTVSRRGMHHVVAVPGHEIDRALALLAS
jgi:hypothetical protein